MRRLLRLALAIGCCACWAALTPARADGSDLQAGSAPRPDPCADYGSFAVVDPPGGHRGVLMAQSYSGCADLPSPRPRHPVQIGVDVMIGGGQTQGTDASPQSRLRAPALRNPPRTGH